MAAYKARYRQIDQRLMDQVLLPDLLTARMNALRDMIRPWVGMDTQKLVTMDQFEQAMTVRTRAPGHRPVPGDQAASAAAEWDRRRACSRSWRRAANRSRPSSPRSRIPVRAS